MAARDALQSAALRLIGRKPSAFFSSTKGLEAELVDLLNDVAREIIDYHDWQSLIVFYDMAGDGSTTDFALPPDYQRMLLDATIWDKDSWAWGYTHVLSANEFVQWKERGWYGLTPGAWSIYADQFHFSPAPANGATAVFPYISKNFARSNDNALKPVFTKDDDEFRLDERLLTLGLVWRWREQKRLDATGDQENFFAALSEAATHDKGARVIRKGGSRRPVNARIAWPYELGP